MTIFDVHYGEYVCTISFGTHGSSYIFCNDEGRLCRFDVRGQTVYVYGDDGSKIDKYKTTYRELVGKGSLDDNTYGQPKYISKNGVEYRYDNRLISASTVKFGDRSVTVESVGYHIFEIAYVNIFLASMGFGLYNLVRSFIDEWLRPQKKRRIRYYTQE